MFPALLTIISLPFMRNLNVCAYMRRLTEAFMTYLTAIPLSTVQSPDVNLEITVTGKVFTTDLTVIPLPLMNSFNMFT